jgi:hypothetical protein
MPRLLILVGSNVQTGITIHAGIVQFVVSFAATLLLLNPAWVGDNADAIMGGVPTIRHSWWPSPEGSGYGAKRTMFVTRLSCIAPLTITIFMRRRGINTPLLPTHRRGIVWLPPLARCLIPSQAPSPCPEPRMSSSGPPESWEKDTQSHVLGRFNPRTRRRTQPL